MVFKGGTTLSKVWGIIKRFSEDIDISIDRSILGYDGEFTKKRLKKLRKTSSTFVRDILSKDLQNKFDELGLNSFLSIEAESDGEGDKTYPEPRQLHIYYKSVCFTNENPYLREEVLLEVGARALFEPVTMAKVKSFAEESFPQVFDNDYHSNIVVAVAEKTFLEKAFLLHEIFSTDKCKSAKRKSRHLYDLCKMMDAGIGVSAIKNDELWFSINTHRKMFTSISGIDYSADIRKQIKLLPPQEVIDIWRDDYNTMASNMIYDSNAPSFDRLLDEVAKIQKCFRES
jgi:hypothetical protein